MDYYSLFWGPGVISTIDEPRGAFTCRSSRLAVFVDSGTFHGLLLNFGCQHSQFWLILAGFMDYYSPFWGPEAISIVIEPEGALMCRPSTLAVLADSGPFHGLLLTVFGSRSDFHD